ncbi:hypothetical protein OQA88_212 [Cercophora sp. LCS_1]
MGSQGYQILILGGGIAGLSAALAATKFAPPGLCPAVAIFEIRLKPGTVGGAVSLSPNALRILDHLGVLEIIRRRRLGISTDAVEVFSAYTARRLCEISFRGPVNEGIGSPPYKALRITRADLMAALVKVVDGAPNITLSCGKRATSIREDSSGVTIVFSDGTTSPHGHVLIGCDGVHSFTRNHHVDPTRRQVYSGLANAFGFVPLAEKEPVHFATSAINLARGGMLLTSYFEPTRRFGYVGAIVALPDPGLIEEWKGGSGNSMIRAKITERFGDALLPTVRVFVRDATDWFMWPIYSLPPLGRWATERTVLLGDAAHAMPPQGETIGLALEDSVLLARCLHSVARHKGCIKEAFESYERVRRPRINAAYRESEDVVYSVRTSSWLGYELKALVVPFLLWPITRTSISIATSPIAASSIAAGSIAASPVAAGSSATRSIATSPIAAGSITAGSIAAGPVAAGSSATRSIAASPIAAGSITAGSIAASSIAAGSITAGSIAASSIAAGSITAGPVAAGSSATRSIATRPIAAGSITAGSIAADPVAAGSSATRSIAASPVAAGSSVTGGIAANTPASYGAAIALVNDV